MHNMPIANKNAESIYKEFHNKLNTSSTTYPNTYILYLNCSLLELSSKRGGFICLQLVSHWN